MRAKIKDDQAKVGIAQAFLTGNWPDIELKGAKIVNGALDVDSGKWAITVGDYKGPPIKEKTLFEYYETATNFSLICKINCTKM